MKYTESLKENAEFRRIYKRGRSSVSPYLVVYARRFSGRAINRLGIQTSTKVGHAVQRNKLRRQLRAIYRLNEDKFQRGYDVVVVVRPKCRELTYSRLEEEFLRLCTGTGVIQ